MEKVIKTRTRHLRLGVGPKTTKIRETAELYPVGSGRDEAIQKYWDLVQRGKIQEAWGDVVRIENAYYIDPISKIRMRGYGFSDIPLGVNKRWPHGSLGTRSA